MWKELNNDPKVGHTFVLSLPPGKGTLMMVIGNYSRSIVHVPAPLDAIEHAFCKAPPRMPDFDARAYAVADSTRGYVGRGPEGRLVNGVERPESVTYAEAAALLIEWMNCGYLGAIVEVNHGGS